MPFRVRSWTLPITVLALAGPLVAKLAWWSVDRGPTAWDDSADLSRSIALYDAWVERGLSGLHDAFMHLGAPNGPLFPLEALPFLALFGRSVASAQLVNAAGLVLLSIYILLLCRRFWPAPVGVLAVFVLGSSPLMYGLSTWYLRDYALAVLVTMTAHHLVGSQGLRRLSQRLVVGLLLGLGVLHRQVFPFYVLPMFLVVVWMRWHDEAAAASGRSRRRILLDAAVPWLVAALLAGPWYLHDGGRAFAHAWSSWVGFESTYYGSAGGPSLATAMAYLATFATEVITAWHLALVGLAALACIWGARNLRLPPSEVIPPAIRLPLLAWCAPLVVLVFSVNDDPRFAAPVLVPLAVLSAALLWNAARALRGGRAWLVALMIPNAVLGSVVLFGWPVANADLPLSLTRPAYARAYSRSSWPHAEILRQAVQLTPRDHRPLIVVVSDTQSFNANLFELLARLDRLDCQVEHSSWHTPAAARTLLEHADIVLRKDNDEVENAGVPNPGPALFLAHFASRGFSEATPWPLPDGSNAHIWIREH